MKKILLAALAALTLVGTAHAGWVSPHIKNDQVTFRTKIAANASSVWDSCVSQRVGIAGATAPCETTLAMPTYDWLHVQNQALGDTSGFYIKLIVSDAIGAPVGCGGGGTSESGADSIAVAAEVSADGVTWVGVLSFVGGTNGVTKATKNNQTIVDGTYQDQLSVNGAALNGGPPVWVFQYKSRAVSQTHTVDKGGLAGWPYIRFIFKYHMAKAFKVSAVVAHWSASDN